MKLKLNYHDLFDQVRPVMKTKQDNDVIDRISAFYVGNNNKLSWPIKLGAIFDKNQIRQRSDHSYRSSLRRKQY